MKLGIFKLAALCALTLNMGIALAAQQDDVEEYERVQAEPAFVSGKGIFREIPDLPGFLQSSLHVAASQTPTSMPPNSGAFPDMKTMGFINDDPNYLFEVVNISAIGMNGYTPADCTVAAGPDHVLVCTNDDIAVYDRFGNAMLEPVDINTFTGDSRQITAPRAFYDRQNNRFVMTWSIYEYTAPNVAAAESRVKVMISQSPDPTNLWWTYNTNAKDDNGTPTRRHFMEDPVVGMNLDCIVIAGKMEPFAGSGATGTYEKVVFWDLAAMYTGGAASGTAVRGFTLGGTNDFRLVPAIMKSYPQNGADYAMYLMASKTFAASTLSLYNFSTGPGGTATLFASDLISVNAYAQAPDLEQGGSNPDLDNTDLRLQNLIYYNSLLYASHVIEYSGAGTSAVRYYRIRKQSPPVVEIDHNLEVGNADKSFPALAHGTDGDFVVFHMGCSELLLEKPYLRYNFNRTTKTR